jgi:hypothetical protein
MDLELILAVVLPIGYLFLTSIIACYTYHNDRITKNYWLDWIIVTFAGPFILLLWILIVAGLAVITPIIMIFKCLLAIFHLPFRCCMKKETIACYDYYIFDWPLKKRNKWKPGNIRNDQSRQTPSITIEFI